MNSCSESKHVKTEFNIILNAIALQIFLKFLLSVATRVGSPHQHVPITVLWAVDANFREGGKP